MENNNYLLYQIYQTATFTPFSNCKMKNALTSLLSVWNAHGKRSNKQQNRILEKTVIRRLVKNGLKPQLIWGGSANMDYRELTIVFNANSLYLAKSYAKFAKQNAFYVVKKRQVYLVKTMGREKPLKLAYLDKHTKNYPLRLLKYGKNQAVAE
ncbi:hypothetical protein [Pseudoalteromonas sp.]|uniref:hypothetical protein n=1 Tax=Pseudoalteromonas sp. TaxID=53249 RepID=UPI003569DC0B